MGVCYCGTMVHFCIARHCGIGGRRANIAKSADRVGAWSIDHVNATGKMEQVTSLLCRVYDEQVFLYLNPHSLATSGGANPVCGVCPKGDCKAGSRWLQQGILHGNQLCLCGFTLSLHFSDKALQYLRLLQ